MQGIELAEFNLPLRESGMEANCNAIVATKFQPQAEMGKEAGAVRLGDYRDGYEDLRKKEEKCNENGAEISDGDFGAGDDVCPICLDSFTIPCRSNCGHLFCATCILQLWMYRYSIQPCKCPLCCCRIVNLELQASEQADNGGEVLKEVQHYNGLYISGLFGALHILPLLMGRVFRVLVDLDYLRCIYYIMRIIGLFLGLLYERLEFEFLPTGGLGIHRMFDLVASLLVAALFLVGVAYRWMLKRRARLLVLVDR